MGWTEAAAATASQPLVRGLVEPKLSVKGPYPSLTVSPLRPFAFYPLCSPSTSACPNVDWLCFSTASLYYQPACLSLTAGNGSTNQLSNRHKPGSGLLSRPSYR